MTTAPINVRGHRTFGEVRFEDTRWSYPYVQGSYDMAPFPLKGPPTRPVKIVGRSNQQFSDFVSGMRGCRHDGEVCSYKMITSLHTQR